MVTGMEPGMLSIAVRHKISVGATCGDGKKVLPIIVLVTRRETSQCGR